MTYNTSQFDCNNHFEPCLSPPSLASDGIIRVDFYINNQLVSVCMTGNSEASGQEAPVNDHL